MEGRRRSLRLLDYKTLHSQGKSTMAERKGKKPDKRSEVEEEGAVGGDVLQIAATEREMAELDKENAGPPVAVRPKSAAKKGTRAAQQSSPQVAGDIADDAVFVELQTQMDEELREQQRTQLRLRRMKEIRDQAARRDELRRQNELLAAELDVGEGYVVNRNTFLIEESKRKVNEWMTKSKNVEIFQTVRSALSDPGGRKNNTNVPAENAELTRFNDLTTTAVTRRIADNRDPHLDIASIARPARLTTHALPFDIEPIVPRSAQPPEIHPHLSLLEHVASADKEHLFSRNAAFQQMQQRGVWPDDEERQGLMAPPQAPLPRAVPQQRPPPPVALPQDVPVLQMAQQQPVPQRPPVNPIMDFEGESTITHKSQASKESNKKNKKLKSGFLVKPDTNVRQQVLCPHIMQNRCFVHKPVAFDKLSFECFIAGESRIIELSKDPNEMMGRLRLMQRVCYWKAGGAPWHKVRAMYQAIIRMIEDGEMHWLIPLYQFDALMNVDYDLIANGPKSFKKHHPRSPTGTKGEHTDVWFCKDFNRGECPETSPHTVTYRGNEKTAWHICAKCWKEKHERHNHPEASNDCPLRN